MIRLRRVGWFRLRESELGCPHDENQINPDEYFFHDSTSRFRFTLNLNETPKAYRSWWLPDNRYSLQSYKYKARWLLMIGLYFSIAR